MGFDKRAFLQQFGEDEEEAAPARIVPNALRPPAAEPAPKPAYDYTKGVPDGQFPSTGSGRAAVDYAAKQREEEKNRATPWQAAGVGAVSGATFDYDDEMAGLIEKVQGGSYKGGRDARRDRKAKMASDQPGSYGLGGVVGGAATAIIPGLNVVKGATALKAAATGAKLGVLEGTGSSTAELASDDPEERDYTGAAKDAVVGGIKGAAAGGLTQRVVTHIRGVPVLEEAEDAAARAAGAGGAPPRSGGAASRVENADLAGLKEGAQYSTKVKVFGRKGSEAEVTRILNAAPETKASIVALKGQPPIETVDNAVSMVDKRKALATSKLEAIYDKARSAGGHTEYGAIDGALADVEKSFATVARKPQAKAVAAIREELTERWGGRSVTVDELRAEYRDWQDMANKAAKVVGPKSGRDEMAEDVANALREQLQQTVARVADANPALGISRQALQDANRDVSRWIDVSKLVEEKALRLRANAPPMGDMITGVKNALSAPGKVAGALAGKLSEKADRAVFVKLEKAANAGNQQAIEALRKLYGKWQQGTTARAGEVSEDY
jgi:hypothetical protein